MSYAPCMTLLSKHPPHSAACQIPSAEHYAVRQLDISGDHNVHTIESPPGDVFSTGYPSIKLYELVSLHSNTAIAFCKLTFAHNSSLILFCQINSHQALTS